MACRTKVDLTEVRFLKLETFEPGMLSQIACPKKESAAHPITTELSFKEIKSAAFFPPKAGFLCNSINMVAHQKIFLTPKLPKVSEQRTSYDFAAEPRNGPEKKARRSPLISFPS